MGKETKGFKLGYSIHAPLSKAPKNKRKKDLDERRLNFIKEYRAKHPKVNQHVIKPELDEYCEREGIRKLSASTISRRIKYLKEKGLIRDDINLSFNGRSGKIHERKRIKKKRTVEGNIIL